MKDEMRQLLYELRVWVREVMDHRWMDRRDATAEHRDSAAESELYFREVAKYRR